MASGDGLRIDELVHLLAPVGLYLGVLDGEGESVDLELDALLHLKRRPWLPIIVN